LVAGLTDNRIVHLHARHINRSGLPILARFCLMSAPATTAILGAQVAVPKRPAPLHSRSHPFSMLRPARERTSTWERIFMTNKPSPHFELRGTKHSPSLSDETNAYTATLYRDGKPMVRVSNHGTGDCEMQYPIGPFTPADITATDQWMAANLPPAPSIRGARSADRRSRLDRQPAEGCLGQRSRCRP
jgi:hypothetical protein